ncbi:MAG: aminopeptidase P family protein [Planctomycetota bacterium]
MPQGTQTAAFADRRRKVRKALKTHDVDALLVVAPHDIRFLTGFVGDDSWALLPTRGGKPIILSDARFTEQIAREAPDSAAVIRQGKMVDALKGVLGKRKTIERVGYQADHLTVAESRTLGKAMRGVVGLKATEGITDHARLHKSPDEIKLIRKALDIQQKAFVETLDFIEPGQTEAEVAAFLEYRMRTLGADGVSFPSIVAADANAALPHAIPGRAKIKRNGIVLIDWGARFGGYCSDLTRVIGVGGMKPKMREVFQIVLDAQMAAIEAIGPGVRLADVDAVARDHITAAGYGPQFGHSLGHGLGLLVHEEPRLAKVAKGVLEPGMVVTVEPGIYLPGVGGVRIEDDVLVTARGHEVLSGLPKSLDSAII